MKIGDAILNGLNRGILPCCKIISRRFSMGGTQENKNKLDCDNILIIV
jgi:hypothetical protein